MLTLLPLSGLTAALKGRNSKTLDFNRRDSISVYANYSLPTNSKSSMRRFSTYDGLAPVFHILADEGKLSLSAPAATSEPSRKQKTLSLRRGSISSLISFGKTKPKPVPPSPEDACAHLDAQIERIKDQLALLKNEDLEMSQRVNNLSNSVEELCKSPIQSAQPARPRLSELRRHSFAEAMLRRPDSYSNLEVVQESDLESDDDDLSFEDYCKSYIPKVGKRESHPKVQVPSFDEVDTLSVPKRESLPKVQVPSFDEVDTLSVPKRESLPKVQIPSFDEVDTLSDPKKDIIPNNLFKPKAKSVPARLDIIWNDLSLPAPQSQRLSMISCYSDSVVITGKYQPSSLSFEHTL